MPVILDILDIQVSAINIDREIQVLSYNFYTITVCNNNSDDDILIIIEL